MAINSSDNFGTQVNVGINVLSSAPKVSVVIPAYNVADFIDEAISSVTAQEFRDLEIIVVNDGSPDTPKFERAISRHRPNIIYIKQPNLGASSARNTAIKHARGELIAFLDGDDMWLPEFLTSQVAFLKRGYEMAYCDAYQFGMRSVLRTTFMQSAPSEGEVTAAALLDFRCNVITSGTVATKASLIRAGLFETGFAKAHDFHLWVRMAKSGARIGYQRLPLAKYRVHLNSLSGDSVNRVDREINVFKRLKETVDLDQHELKILDRRLVGLEADHHIELGKAFLLNEDFKSAHQSFAAANSIKRTLKLTAIEWFARLAPTVLLNHYRKHRPDEIAFVPKGL